MTHSRSSSRQTLRRPRTMGTYNSLALTNRQDLICLDLLETLDFLRGRPFHLNHVNLQGLSQAKMQAQVALRHDAGAAVNLIYLNVLARDDADARADGGAIAVGAD